MLSFREFFLLSFLDIRNFFADTESDGDKMKKPLLNLKKQNTKSDYYDYNLVAVIVLLVCFGLVMLYSTSSYMAEVNYGNDMFYFKKQALISAACLIGAFCAIKNNLYRRYPNRISTKMPPKTPSSSQIMEKIISF